MSQEKKQKQFYREEDNNKQKQNKQNKENMIDDLIDDLEDVLNETEERRKVPRKGGE